MKAFIIIFLLLANILPSKAQNTSTGIEFWNKHKEEILSTYLEYEVLNKVWFERTQKVDTTAKYRHYGGYHHYSGTGEHSSQTLFLIKSKGIVNTKEQDKLATALESKNIERAWFRVGIGSKHKMVSSLVFPQKYEDVRNSNILWDEDIEPNSGTPYDFNAGAKGREDIFVKCLAYKDKSTRESKMKVSIYSDFGTCVLYMKN